MRMTSKVVVCAGLLALAGCVDDPYRRTKIGAGVGAASGAVIGSQVAKNDGRGALIGAAIGALAGGAVGNYMDRQQRAMEEALAAEQQRNNIQIQRLQDNTLKLDIPSEISFDYNSAAIRPAFVPTLNRVGDVLRQYPNSVVHVVGHTDSTGSDDYNLGLSRERSGSVANYLASQGVDPQRLRTQGMGEAQPRASNANEAGRQLNRRVELYIKPIVEGQEQYAYQTPVGGSGPPPQGGGYQGGGYQGGAPQQGGYPQGDAPPQGGYGGGYQGGAPQQGGYGGYPPQGGYGGSPQGGYQGGYPQQQGTYQGGYGSPGRSY